METCILDCKRVRPQFLRWLTTKLIGCTCSVPVRWQDNYGNDKDEFTSMKLQILKIESNMHVQVRICDEEKLPFRFLFSTRTFHLFPTKVVVFLTFKLLVFIDVSLLGAHVLSWRQSLESENFCM
jgi:hypothetical protein